MSSPSSAIVSAISLSRTRPTTAACMGTDKEESQVHAAGGSGDFRNEWNAVLSGGLDDGYLPSRLPVTGIKVKNGKSKALVRQSG